MAGPSFPDILYDLMQKQAITSRDFDQFIYNYRFFDQQRSNIQRLYPHQWVAALELKLYNSKDFNDLRAQLRDRQNFRYAYIEQIL